MGFHAWQASKNSRRMIAKLRVRAKTTSHSWLPMASRLAALLVVCSSGYYSLLVPRAIHRRLLAMFGWFSAARSFASRSKCVTLGPRLSRNVRARPFVVFLLWASSVRCQSCFWTRRDSKNFVPFADEAFHRLSRSSLAHPAVPQTLLVLSSATAARILPAHSTTPSNPPHEMLSR